MKNEGSKHEAREFYLISAIDHDQSIASIQKFCGSTLRNKQYEVKLNEIYPAATNYISSKENTTDEQIENDEGIELHNHGTDQGSLRRSGRERRQPDWLATKEIQRVVNSEGE